MNTTSDIIRTEQERLKTINTNDIPVVPSFNEQIEDIEAQIHATQDIIEYYRTIGKDCSCLLDDIDEYNAEIKEIKEQQHRYNQNVL